MQDLELQGVHDDGEHLVLLGEDGQRFRLRVDETLRAAVRRDRARLSQLQIQEQGRLRPREIQARIRGGSTAEEVAEQSGVPVEHVRRYEGPVLAEREHVADQARRAPLRRSGAGRGQSLEDVVVERLTARGADVEALRWDSWRREGASWVVVLSFRTGSRERRAEWSWDPGLRAAVALDDEARWLSEDGTTAEEGPLGGRTARGGPRAPARAAEVVYDVEADGGVHPTGPAPVVGHGAGDGAARNGQPRNGQPRNGTAPNGTAPGDAGGDAAPPPAAPLDLLDALRERRGRRGRRGRGSSGGTRTPAPAETPPSEPSLEDALIPGLEVRDAPEDPVGDLLAQLGEPPSAHPPASRPDEAHDAEVLELPDAEVADEVQTADERVEDEPAEDERAGAPAAEAQARDDVPATDAATAATDVPGDGADPPEERQEPPVGAAEDRAAARPRPPAARGRRASVPSWDEIVFGARRE